MILNDIAISGIYENTNDIKDLCEISTINFSITNMSNIESIYEIKVHPNIVKQKNIFLPNKQITSISFNIELNILYKKHLDTRAHNYLTRFAFIKKFENFSAHDLKIIDINFVINETFEISFSLLILFISSDVDIKKDNNKIQNYNMRLDTRKEFF